jgi:hypothetical protein
MLDPLCDTCHSHTSKWHEDNTSPVSCNREPTIAWCYVAFPSDLYCTPVDEVHRLTDITARVYKYVGSLSNHTTKHITKNEKKFRAEIETSFVIYILTDMAFLLIYVRNVCHNQITKCLPLLWIVLESKPNRIRISCAFMHKYESYCYCYSYYDFFTSSRIPTITHLKQTVSLWYITLQLFCDYSIWYLWCYFPWWKSCAFTLVLFEIYAQYPVWLFYVLPLCRAFQVCCLYIL